MEIALGKREEHDSIVPAFGVGFLFSWDHPDVQFVSHVIPRSSVFQNFDSIRSFRVNLRGSIGFLVGSIRELIIRKELGVKGCAVRPGSFQDFPAYVLSLWSLITSNCILALHRNAALPTRQEFPWRLYTPREQRDNLPIQCQFSFTLRVRGHRGTSPTLHTACTDFLHIHPGRNWKITASSIRWDLNEMKRTRWYLDGAPLACSWIRPGIHEV